MKSSTRSLCLRRNSITQRTRTRLNRMSDRVEKSCSESAEELSYCHVVARRPTTKCSSPQTISFHSSSANTKPTNFIMSSRLTLIALLIARVIQFFMFSSILDRYAATHCRIHQLLARWHGCRRWIIRFAFLTLPLAAELFLIKIFAIARTRREECGKRQGEVSNGN